jgi:hypothetical protein
MGDSTKIRVAFLNYTFLLNEVSIREGLRYVDYLRAGRYVSWFDASVPDGLVARFARDRIFRSKRYADRESFLQDVSRTIELARRDGAEYVILFLHWGRYYHTMPGIDQRQMALELCRPGADVIVGAGPHMIQPRERLYTNGNRVESDSRGTREHFVAYSLGNLVTNGQTAARYGMLLDLRLARTENGVYVQGVETHIVKGVPEVVTVPLVDGGTAPLTTCHAEIAGISDFLQAIAEGGNTRGNP